MYEPFASGSSASRAFTSDAGRSRYFFASSASSGYRRSRISAVTWKTCSKSGSSISIRTRGCIRMRSAARWKVSIASS